MFALSARRAFHDAIQLVVCQQNALGIRYNHDFLFRVASIHSEAAATVTIDVWAICHVKAFDLRLIFLIV